MQGLLSLCGTIRFLLMLSSPSRTEFKFFETWFSHHNFAFFNNPKVHPVDFYQITFVYFLHFSWQLCTKTWSCILFTFVIFSLELQSMSLMINILSEISGIFQYQIDPFNPVLVHLEMYLMSCEVVKHLNWVLVWNLQVD